jgi:hypothetical protein
MVTVMPSGRASFSLLSLLACSLGLGGLGLGGLGSTLGCGPATAQTSAANPEGTKATPPSSPAKIDGFNVATDSLTVDRVGMRDGELVPDGSKDLAFDAVVTGPVTQIFLFQTDDKCSPSGSFRADTMTGSQEAPRELGGSLELGRLALGMGVVEGGKFINRETGAIPPLNAERHTLRLYVGNTNTLTPGTHACLFVLQPDGVLVRSTPLNF